MKHSLIYLATVLLGIHSITANAGLTALGDRVYDSSLQAEWVSDANLLGTKENALPALAPQTIIDSISAIGSHTLSLGDFGSNGQINWFAATAFVDYLNNTHYDGYNNWRLPNTSELLSLLDQLVVHDINEHNYTLVSHHNASTYPLFSNITSAIYWSADVNLYDNTAAENINTYYNYPGTNDKSIVVNHYAFIIRSAVPEPSILMLLSVGILALSRSKQLKAILKVTA